jgi:hypothetical protein
MTKEEMYHAELASQCKGLVWRYSIGIGFAPTARENNFMRGQLRGYELAYKALKVGDTLKWLNKIISEEAAKFADQDPGPEHDKTDGFINALSHVRDAIMNKEYLYNEE